MSQNFALEIESLISRLQPIRLEVLQAEQHFQKELDHVYLGNLQSARNLAHYLSLRRHDIRELQEDLGRLALTSLGHLESHVIATLDALLALLHKIAGKNWHGRAIEETFAEFDSGLALLEKHTIGSLGEVPTDRNVRIMVTMPSEAADDPTLIRNFLVRGMNIMRVNCAHDSAVEWLRMVENLRAAQKETGKACKIAFDLAGPKLRTGPIYPSPGIIRWKPVRNELGQVTRSAYITFCSEDYSSGDETIAIPVKGSIFRHAQAGYTIELTDTRGRPRSLLVVEVDRSSCVCTNDRTGYVVQGAYGHGSTPSRL
jgi:pyruvate kinase